MDQIDLENQIEKKFRDVLLESQIISYILQKDHKAAFLVDENSFTIEPYQFFLTMSRKNQMEYPKQTLWKIIKKEIPDDDFDIYKKYIIKVYDAKLKNITPKNIEKLCNKLLELQHSRKFMNLIADTISDVSKFDLENSKFKFRNMIMTSDIKIRSSIDYVKDFPQRRDHLREIAKDPKNLAGIPTGIKDFDKLTGGVMRREWGIIIAGTGTGKSVSLGDLATNAYYRGYNAVIATLELGNREYSYRLDAKNTRIDYSKFRKAELNIFDYEKWEVKMERYRMRKNNFIRIESFPRGSTIGDIESSLYRIQAEEEQKIDLLLLDYITLVSPTQAYGSHKDWKSQTDVAWELKELCESFNDGLGIAAWTANQLTDEGLKSKKINTSHMKYARGISEAAPIIIALNQSEESKLQDIIEMYIIKCRNFEKQNKPIILYPNLKYMTINDPSRSENRARDKK
jgi:replicative DNA helicase